MSEVDKGEWKRKKELEMSTLSSPEGLRAKTDKSQLLETEDGEDVVRRRLDSGQARRWRCITLTVTYSSVLITTTLGVIAIVIATTDRSSSMFAFALDSLLDTVSSVIVLWRYYGSVSTLYSEQRETKAVRVLSILFIVSALSTAARSCAALATRTTPDRRDPVLEQLAVVDTALCLLLAALKLLCAYQLESQSVFVDSMNSGIGALMGGAVFASSAVYQRYTRIWYLDSTLGVLVSLLMLLYGIRLLFTTCTRKV